MAILYDANAKTYTLSTENSTYQMKVDDLGTLIHTYYGKKIPHEDLSYLVECNGCSFSGNPHYAEGRRGYSPDTMPLECSTFGCGDFRTTMLGIRNADGTLGCDLTFCSAEIKEGKYGIKGMPAFYDNGGEAQTLIVTLKDRVYDIYVHLYYGVFEETDLITRTVVIENRTDKPVKLDKALSVSLDLQHGTFDAVTFNGRHASEREFNRSPIEPGKRSVGSLRGASSHQHSPMAILCDRTVTEESGDCYGFSFVYSGNFLFEVEQDQLRQTRVVMGIHPENFCYTLAPGASFEAPEVAMTYSDSGFSRLSHSYHRAIRHNLCRGKYKLARRPSLINNWEGTYMDFTGDKLVAMAQDASKLGIELFVMDDGWFGKRDDDRSGLGDWIVNEKKIGYPLSELANRITATGMKFGIWFEPECISEDSDLYRTHPDWAIAMPDRAPILSRHQLVLDFSREDVRNYIYDSVAKVLRSADISYVKWDFNRHISDVYSAHLPADRQGEFNHRYVLGLYAFMERLVTEFPDILFEGCSGGGGRFDCGILYYMPQIWCSDDTDPVERTKIQYGTSFGFPACTVGSHVSASPNHQTTRRTPIHTRGVVALAGDYGVELDINKMTDGEKEAIRRQVEDYKKYASLVSDGRYYRLTDPFNEKEHYVVWEFAAEDGSEALVSAVYVRAHASVIPCMVKVKGLCSHKKYRVNGSEETYSGAALMNGGLKIRFLWGDEYFADTYHITVAE